MANPVANIPCEDDEIHGKKRRNENEWKRNKRKKLRANGEEYISTSGKTFPKRETGNKCRCRRQCLRAFSDETKEAILVNFNKLGDQVAQDAYLIGGIKPSCVKRRRPRNNDGKERSFQYTYKVKYGDEEKVVCRDGYASIHGIGVFRIRRLSGFSANGTSPSENRGKHNNRPRSISADHCALIDRHIRSFPYQVSHYGRHRTKRRYLSTELSVRKMYVLFLGSHFPAEFLQVKGGVEPEDVKCDVRYSFYLKFFNENFNYGFGRPRTDECGKCAEFEAKLSIEKNMARKKKLQTEQSVHKRKAKAFYMKLAQATTEAEEMEDVETISIDFQQNIPYPHLPVGEIFYMRQLWLYNFCIYSAKQKESTMYMYPETTANRGANEVISCLDHYLENLPPAVKKLRLFSDGCRGQNYNHTMVQYLHTLVRIGRFDEIEHHLPIRGHSFLPCDRHFATIEREKRKQELIEWYPAWMDMVEKTFKVVRVEQGMIKDFKGHLAQKFKKTTKRGADVYKVSEYKLFRFSKSHPYEVSVSTTMMAVCCQKFSILKPNATASMPTGQCYTASIPIKPAKLDDLKKLSKYLKPETQHLVQQLTTMELPEPEDDNSDYDD